MRVGGRSLDGFQVITKSERQLKEAWDTRMKPLTPQVGRLPQDVRNTMPRIDECDATKVLEPDTYKLLATCPRSKPVVLKRDCQSKMKKKMGGFHEPLLLKRHDYVVNRHMCPGGRDCASTALSTVLWPYGAFVFFSCLVPLFGHETRSKAQSGKINMSSHSHLPVELHKGQHQ